MIAPCNYMNKQRFIMQTSEYCKDSQKLHSSIANNPRSVMMFIRGAMKPKTLEDRKMVDTKKMICVFASNSLNSALFVSGKEYTAIREEGKVYVIDSLGLQIEVKGGCTGADGGSVWAYKSDDLGVYHFNIVK